MPGKKRKLMIYDTSDDESDVCTKRKRKSKPKVWKKRVCNTNGDSSSSSSACSDNSSDNESPGGTRSENKREAKTVCNEKLKRKLESTDSGDDSKRKIIRLELSECEDGYDSSKDKEWEFPKPTPPRRRSSPQQKSDIKRVRKTGLSAVPVPVPVPLTKSSSASSASSAEASSASSAAEAISVQPIPPQHVVVSPAGRVLKTRRKPKKLCAPLEFLTKEDRRNRDVAKGEAWLTNNTKVRYGSS